MEEPQDADNGVSALDAYIALYVCPVHGLPYEEWGECERCLAAKRRAAR
jgi:hypothetical protein